MIPVRLKMTPVACRCFNGRPGGAQKRQIRQAQVQCLPVRDRDKHRIGMLSLGDGATRGSAEAAVQTLAEAVQPSWSDRCGQSAAMGAAGGAATRDQPS